MQVGNSSRQSSAQNLDVIESIFQIVDLDLLFEQHREQNGRLNEQGLVNRAWISVQVRILEESIEYFLISRSKRSAIRIPSRLTVAALHHCR